VGLDFFHDSKTNSFNRIRGALLSFLPGFEALVVGGGTSHFGDCLYISIHDTHLVSVSSGMVDGWIYHITSHFHTFTPLPGYVIVEFINKWCQQAKLVSTSSAAVSILTGE